MRAIVLEMPRAWLDERRRTGADRWDEVWDGVLHVVPPPGTRHQRFAALLQRCLAALVEARGLEVLYETAVFDPRAGESNYRVPDIVVVRSAHLSARGVEGRAELAIEILSDHDESREKLPFYAACGIPEVWLVHPETRAFELYALRAGAYARATRSEVLDVQLAVGDGPKLRLAWPGGAAEI